MIHINFMAIIDADDLEQINTLNDIVIKSRGKVFIPQKNIERDKKSS